MPQAFHLVSFAREQNFEERGVSMQSGDDGEGGGMPLKRPRKDPVR